MFYTPRKYLIQLILLFSLGLTGCGSLFGPKATPTPIPPTFTPAPPTATPEPMAFTVNGEGITEIEFNAELARYKAAQTALGKTVNDADASKAVTEDLIAQLLLVQGAKANGFTLTDSSLQSRIDALAQQSGGTDKLSAWESAHGYTDETFRISLKISVEAAWMRDKIVSAVPTTADQVHLQQILFYNSTDADAVLTQLKGGADFSQLAATYDPTTRGELGWVPKGYLLDPNIEEAVFSLQAGQYSDVIETDTGYHIIKVLERDPQHPLSPDAYLTLQELALKNWVAEQRSKAVITPGSS